MIVISMEQRIKEKNCENNGLENLLKRVISG